MSNQEGGKKNLGLPSDKTLQQAVKLSIKTAKPICFYFYVDSLKKKISICSDGEDKIIFKNQKIYKGEKNADIYIKSPKKIKPINCPTKFNSGAIDEFLLIFLVAARAKGISYFKDLSELNQKESPRLKWGEKILNLMGIKTLSTESSIKIFGNPNLKINNKIIIKNYLKDHRVFMTSVIAALSFGGQWDIHDKDSIKTSFPNFLNIIRDLKK